MKKLSSLVFIYLTLMNTQALAVNPCLLPERPWVPISDADIREYADIIADDFENYFSDLTKYFQCMDSEREHIIAESQQVSAQAQYFWQRVKILGVESKVVNGADKNLVK